MKRANHAENSNNAIFEIVQSLQKEPRTKRGTDQLFIDESAAHGLFKSGSLLTSNSRDSTHRAARE
jgi:hypothetical protein